MSLKTFQQALRTLYTSEETQLAVQSVQHLETFAAQSDLTPAEQAGLLKTSLVGLDQYRFMLLANAQDTLESVFPYVRTLLGERWAEVTEAYFYQVPCPSFLIVDYGRGFSEFLSAEAERFPAFPYLPELAAYEWVEVELQNALNPNYPAALNPVVPTDVQSFAQLSPVLNETAVFLPCQYPIPDILENLDTAAQQGEIWDGDGITPNPTFLWVFRNAQSPYHCRYFKLNALLAAWITTAWEAQQQNRQATYAQILYVVFEGIQTSIPGLQYADCLTQFLPIVQQLYQIGLLLGSISPEVLCTKSEGE